MESYNLGLTFDPVNVNSRQTRWYLMQFCIASLLIHLSNQKEYLTKLYLLGRSVLNPLTIVKYSIFTFIQYIIVNIFISNNYIYIIFPFLFTGGESVLLSAGIHSFPFKLGLPLGLPSTFLGKHGWVQVMF